MAFALFVLLCAGSATASELTSEDAAKHIGENATVCGVVGSVHYAAGTRAQPTFLNFGASYPDQIFTAVVFGNDRARFGDLGRLAGQRICVTGTIRIYRNKPEIVLHDPGQVK